MSANRFIGMRWPSTRWLTTLLSICIVLCSAGNPSFAAECRKVNTVCAEPGGTRNIGGVDVTRDCWRYEDSYECVAPHSVDYCAAIATTLSPYLSNTSAASPSSRRRSGRGRPQGVAR
jgi:conjugal transfer mating pair stabilization protein TraN